jgi:hypothetical protein
VNACFHCGATDGSPGLCSCLTCDGKCQACAGRAKMAKTLELAQRLRLDVQDIRNYEIVTEGPHRYRRLKLPVGVAA